MNRIFQPIIGACLALTLTACGGGGGGGSSASSLASGGVGGTGKGTVTGFGSIIVNDTRELEISPDTDIRIDGVEATEADFKKGMVVDFVVDTDLSDDFTLGTALTMEANHLVKGPVTSVSPLSVLEQPVVITGNTVLENVTGGDTGNLNIGDIVEVAGFGDGNGIIQAARLEFKPAGTTVWKITGTVSNVVPGNSFTIGSLDISQNGVAPRDCAGGLQNGNYVEVKADPDSTYGSSGVLSTVVDIECVRNGLVAPSQLNALVIQGEIEGYITALPSADEVRIGDQRVLLASAVEYEGGTQLDLAIGVKIEAEGDFNTTDNTLTADKIRFRETRVRIEAPLFASDITAGEGFTVMGILVQATAQTDDQDNIVSGGGSDRQVEVRGFVDATNTVIAEEIRDRGTLDNSDVRLRGPIANIVPTTFEILGVTADTATATSIRDSNDAPIDSNTFFSLVNEGSLVQVQGATWDGVSRLDNGDIEIED